MEPRIVRHEFTDHVGSHQARCKLGNPEQAKANRLEAEAHAERLPPVLTDLRYLPSRAIAAELTKRAVPTPRAGDWQ
jgi:hypothetical protein